MPDPNDNDFDKASRFSIKLDAVGQIAWALGISPSEFAFREWLDTRGAPFPGHSDRTGDSVAAIEDLQSGGVPWCVAIEFQFEPDPLMFGRMLNYLAGLWIDLKPDPERGSRYMIGGVVFNLTGRGKTNREMYWPRAGLRTQFEFVERNLETESAADTLDAIERGDCSRAVLCWISLMRGGGDADIIGRWKSIAEADENFSRRGNYADMAAAFAGACGRQAVWLEALKGWNMRRSPTVDIWRAEARVEGLAEGRVEGRVETQRDNLTTLLTDRFGSVPDEMIEAIRSTDDFDTLARWFRLALRADLAELQSRIRT